MTTVRTVGSARPKDVRLLPWLLVARGPATATGGGAYTVGEGGSFQAVTIPRALAGGALTWAVLSESMEHAHEADAVLVRFAKRVAIIAQVVAISHAIEETIHRVWTFIHRRDKVVRQQVYREELRLMEEFTHIRFDFNVVSLEGPLTPAFVPDDLQGRVIFYRGDRAT